MQCIRPAVIRRIAGICILIFICAEPVSVDPAQDLAEMEHASECGDGHLLVRSWHPCCYDISDR